MKIVCQKNDLTVYLLFYALIVGQYGRLKGTYFM